MDQLKFLDKYLRGNRKSMSNLEDKVENALSDEKVLHYSQITNISDLLEMPLPKSPTPDFSKNDYTRKSWNNFPSFIQENKEMDESSDEIENDTESEIDYIEYTENIMDKKRFLNFFNEDIQITIVLLIIIILIIIAIIYWPLLI